MFIATQDKPFLPTNWREKFAQVRALGFDAFEIDGRALLDQTEDIRRASEAENLPVSTICGGYRGWIGDFSQEERAQCLEDITAMLELAGGMGIRGIVVPAAWGMFSLRLPPMVSPRSAEDDREVLLDSLGQLDSVAGVTGTRIFLEPLNRYENHMVLRVEEAVSLIEEGGLLHTQVAADFFHMNIEEAHIEKTLAGFAPHIGHVHLASSQRLQPGMGHLDYVPGLRSLFSRGYDGGCAVECRVEAEDPVRAYRESATLVREALQEAGAPA